MPDLWGVKRPRDGARRARDGAAMGRDGARRGRDGDFRGREGALTGREGALIGRSGSNAEAPARLITAVSANLPAPPNAGLATTSALPRGEDGAFPSCAASAACAPDAL